MTNNIPSPRSLAELKALYQQFGAFLTPENQQLMAALIQEMEKGPDKADYSALGKIAGKMEQSAEKSQREINKGQK